jgi:hypothetical protein
MELEFLDGGEPPKDEVQPEQKEEARPQPEAPKDEIPPRDESGKFKAREQEIPTAQPATPPVVPEGTPKEEPIMVPLAALHETRDKVKALEAQLEQFRPRPQPQQPVAIPDPLDDPEGYHLFQEQRVQQAIFNNTLNISEEMARGTHGDELVNAAQQWAQQQFAANPALYAEFSQQRNPYGYIVQQYQRQQMLSRLGGDPKEIEAYLAWKQASAATQQQPAAPAANPATPAPPRSIVDAPSAGGVQHTASGPGVAFDEVIK